MILFISLILISISTDEGFYLSRLKYNGGDWYNDPSALPNLINVMNEKLEMDIGTEENIVDIIQAYDMKVPFIFITWHC